MRFMILLALSIGLALGLGAWTADRALEMSADLGTVEVGPWRANPLGGSPDADPYSRAVLARIGNLTLGGGEGISFRANADSAGRPLMRQCSYGLAGQTPLARVWTLAAYLPDGLLVDPGEGRPGWLVSRSLMRAEDNSAVMTVGPRAAPGNWLSVTGSGEFTLALTLYDTPASTSSGVASLVLPTLTRGDCRDG
ncbi:hypothetical protein Sa4125_12200 [Aureimonas sp. SA4125]|uniref:DUF1214 domain-containing protein n=1 Tax=Aureimonas sp. SA4125 TaxID=2826993 RepID=UPI001CC3C031|nr:DUF1214 domain-containing protein [Aureimonas sp. SA4125]BDA83678.1 hypothetical protein Sa4125_12200 [Aureimonas sp. SA4125]